MLALAQMTFLVLLAGTVLWLAYLGRHQDQAAEADADNASRPASDYFERRSARRS